MSSGTLSSPECPSETSKGSSVSTGLQQEYEELLKYAVVTPKVELPQNVYLHHRDSAFTVRVNPNEPNGDRTTTISSESSSSNFDALKEISQAAKKSVKDLPEFGSVNESMKIVPPQTEEVKEADIVTTVPIPKGNWLKSTTNNVMSTPQSSDTHNSLLSDTSPTTDTDLIRMETLMDEWCLDLKRNVLAEFSNAKLNLVERYREQLCKERERHSTDVFTLQTEIENLKEILHALEKSVSQKDLVIHNMTGAIQKQREKHEQLQTFALWRIRHNDDKRERFASKLATKHYERTLRSRVMTGWRGVVESKWKQRVEKACQARAQEVCVNLTEDYEERLQGLQKNLDKARAEVATLHKERDSYEESMKKAFMRGVCALNMEAITMFRENRVDPQDATTARPSTQAGTTVPLNMHQFTRDDCVVPSQRTGISESTGHLNNAGGLGGRKFPLTKTLQVKATAKGNAAPKGGTGSSFQSAVSSVLVERHTSSIENRQPAKNGKSVRFDTTAGLPKRLGKVSDSVIAPHVKVVE